MASRIAFLFSVAFLLLAGPLKAQTEMAEAITIEHGLSQGMIFDILQTRDGFLWTTTKDGLNRYDGYNFKVYDNNPFDSFSLADNYVTALFEDSRGWLWVGTNSKGLDLFDRRTGRFYHFPLSFQRSDETVSFHVRSISESPDGSIWAIQQGGGLFRIQIPATWREQLPAAANLEKQTTVHKIAVEGGEKNEEWLPNLALRADGTLSIFTTSRQYLVDPRSNRAVPAPVVAGFPGFIASAMPGQEGPETTLWLGDETNGLYVLERGKLSRSECPYSWKSTQFSIQNDGKGNLWLLLNKYIWRLDPKRPPDFSNPDWVLDREATCIATDRNGNIWVGTAGYGLRKINPKRQMFHAGAKGNSVWGLWRTPAGRYFWKQVSEIYAYDPQRRETALRVAFPELAVQRKMDMLIEPSGAFWLLGTGKDLQQGCLYRYDATGHLVQQYLFPLHVYDYARLLAARDGSLWITGARCQLFRFYPATGRFEEWNYGHLFGKQANAVLAFALAEDGNGILWIGTQEGLVKATPRGAQLDVERMQADPHQPQGLNHNSVACLLPDPADPGGILWVGTKGGGINRLDVRSGQFRHFTTADGLPDKVIYGILPGNENPASGQVSLWCSTNRGLVKLSPRPGASAGFDITTFAAAQGLQDNEFNTQAFYKAPGPGGHGGELLFGGVNGLNHFFPEAVQSDTTTPPVFVVGLQVNHQPVSDVGPRGEEALLPLPLEYLRELVLQHDQNNLSFEFSALDFTDPSKNRYRYRLVGLDPDWTAPVCAFYPPGARPLHLAGAGQQRRGPVAGCGASHPDQGAAALVALRGSLFVVRPAVVGGGLVGVSHPDPAGAIARPTGFRAPRNRTGESHGTDENQFFQQCHA